MKQLSFLIKPASSLCDLRCRYCFYADEAANRAQASLGLMTPETAGLLLDEAFSAVDAGGRISFTFQGGEPTLAGLDFFQSFTRRARSQCPPGVGLDFSIQTNGASLDGDWAEFFRREDYLVGISVDGFKELHNAHRVDAGGADTWNRVERGVRLLLRAGVRVNALCVVTAQCARSPRKAYQGLKKLGFRYMQFIACLDPMGGRGQAPHSLTPRAYGAFLCGLFDLWYQDWERGDYCSVRLFEDYVRLLLGDGSSTCATCGRCGSYFVVEGDGSLYPCDFFALDAWRLGRLGERPLTELAEGETARRFLDWGREKPGECAACPWGRICNGGCKNDWVDGPHNYHCEAFRTLFVHGGERLARVARAEAAARGAT